MRLNSLELFNRTVTMVFTFSFRNLGLFILAQNVKSENGKGSDNASSLG